ncbi:class I SAM-dependent methyltransferase [Actinokineospora inagensis]|uniref:class I SAM-dependent methyltransferase n=1 Tax=Actinokineospora inagensis TaxID=103730 RepID=UPI0003FACC4D|nr:methyltransferase [Actinokineospora inagensis]
MSYDRGLRLLAFNQARRPDTFTLLGDTWDLLPGVFSPVYDASTRFFTTHLPYPPGGTMLEIGCGAGITAVTAARVCARVTATDISAAAVDNTRRNAERHGVADRLDARLGDLFDPVPADVRFDLVFWNSPFIESPADHAPGSDLDLAIFDPGYAAHRRFLDQARRYTAPAGRVLLGFGSLGNRDRLDGLAAEAGLTATGFATSPPDQDVTYQLLELTPRP